MILRVLFLLFLASCTETAEEPKSREARIIVMHYPEAYHKPSPEPYRYPGPSPPVKIPPRMQEPYVFNPPASMFYSDYQNLPKWCKNMWEREECGMKCWMLRKICRNMSSQQPYTFNSVQDSEPSPSIPYPFYKPYPYHPYYPKPSPSVTYSKTSLPQTYFANPSWAYPLPRRPMYHRNPIMNNEIGLNPTFTYVDGNEQLTTTTTPKPEETTTTTAPKTSTKVVLPKGKYGVKVTNLYPEDSEVTTLSPSMFEYDQYGHRGYYGDRIYMSTVLPVSGRTTSMRDRMGDVESVELFDDFDEMMSDS